MSNDIQERKRPPTPFMSTAEVARIMGVCTKTIYTMVEDGRLQAIRFARRGHLKFRREVVEALLEKGCA